MSFYEYSQNNSGGFHKMPAIRVFIQAQSEEQANEIAIKHGVYFYDEWDDCADCCGSRWYLEDACSEIPELSENDSYWAEKEGIPARLVIEGVSA